MQSNSQSNSSYSQGQPTLGQSLQSIYKTVKTFMVLRPQPSTQTFTPLAKDKYSAKAGLYPYLLEGEEQRDWLDRLY